MCRNCGFDWVSGAWAQRRRCVSPARASPGSSVQKSTRFQRVMEVEISPALTRQWDRLLFP